MIDLNKIITISELSRLVGVSRPTMYKYLTLYENKEYNNIPVEIIEILNDLNSKNLYSKQEVYNYFSNKFSSTSTRGILDKTKVLIYENKNFNSLLEYLVDNSNKIDFKDILEKLKENLEENGKWISYK